MKDSEVVVKCFLTCEWLTCSDKSRFVSLGRAYQLQLVSIWFPWSSRMQSWLWASTKPSQEWWWFAGEVVVSTTSFVKGFWTILRTRALSLSSYQGTTRCSSRFGDSGVGVCWFCGLSPLHFTHVVLPFDPLDLARWPPWKPVTVDVAFSKHFNFVIFNLFWRWV